MRREVHNRRLCLLAIISCAFVVAATGIAQQPRLKQRHPAHNWDYGDDAYGPGHWGELKPEFAPCMNGHHQSPIDIRNPQKAELPPIVFDYKPSPLDIIDNGHTIEINYAAGSFIAVGGRKYALKQFHFHRPSEEKIVGKGYDMTLHLVHADQEGNLAVVAILLEKGEDNPLIHELWNEIPTQKNKEELAKDIQINAGTLLPADRAYYTFSGSLTTPPCSEHVTWYVLKHPVTISAAEVEQFSKLYRNDARPTQPLYDRVVLESK
jgi:carbonic anhydrase